MTAPIVRAEEILRAACGDRLRTSFSLAPLTTFRIGGPAALFLEPESTADLQAVARAVQETAIPVVVLSVLGADQPGNTILGEAAYRRFLAEVQEGRHFLTDDETEARYLTQAQEALVDLG